MARQLGLSNPAWELQKSIRARLDGLSVDSVLAYNETDVVVTLGAAKTLLAKAAGLYSQEKTLSSSNKYPMAVIRMIMRGQAVDFRALERERVRLLNERKGALSTLFRFQIQGENDAAGIAKFLKSQLPDFPFEKTESGKISTASGAWQKCRKKTQRLQRRFGL